MRGSGRGYLTLNTAELGNPNTICDVTGFKVKLSEVSRRWDGFFVIAAAWNPRQPQDFPVKPIKTTVFANCRSDDGDQRVDPQPFTPL